MLTGIFYSAWSKSSWNWRNHLQTPRSTVHWLPHLRQARNVDKANYALTFNMTSVGCSRLNRCRIFTTTITVAIVTVEPLYPWGRGAGDSNQLIFTQWSHTMRYVQAAWFNVSYFASDTKTNQAFVILPRKLVTSNNNRELFQSRFRLFFKNLYWWLMILFSSRFKMALFIAQPKDFLSSAALQYYMGSRRFRQNTILFPWLEALFLRFWFACLSGKMWFKLGKCSGTASTFKGAGQQIGCFAIGFAARLKSCHFETLEE